VGIRRRYNHHLQKCATALLSSEIRKQSAPSLSSAYSEELTLPLKGDQLRDAICGQQAPVMDLRDD
jgi:hypothetical protein